MANRYYWIRLKEDFFDSIRIKKLRKLAGGDTYTIIYLKMQLRAMKEDGILKYQGIEPSFAEELALDIDEDADNVAVTLQFLQTCGLIETAGDDEFLLPEACENSGSESTSAERVRQHRAKKALQCNTDVTQVKRLCNVEKEIEKEKNKNRGDIEIEGESEREKPARHKYGEYNNVLLTDAELEKLKNEYSDYKAMIENLSNYIASTGKVYKSHYATIRNWARKDAGKKAGAFDVIKAWAEG